MTGNSPALLHDSVNAPLAPPADMAGGVDAAQPAGTAGALLADEEEAAGEEGLLEAPAPVLPPAPPPPPPQPGK